MPRIPPEFVVLPGHLEIGGHSFASGHHPGGPEGTLHDHHPAGHGPPRLPLRLGHFPSQTAVVHRSLRGCRVARSSAMGGYNRHLSISPPGCLQHQKRRAGCHQAFGYSPPVYDMRRPRRTVLATMPNGLPSFLSWMIVPILWEAVPAGQDRPSTPGHTSYQFTAGL